MSNPNAQSWSWVRDLSTGHCYDVPTASLDAGHVPGVQRLTKPDRVSVYPRRPKHHVDLAGDAAHHHQPSTTPVETDAATAAEDEE